MNPESGRPAILVLYAPGSRPFRVIALGAAIGAMSAADLSLTLLFLTHTGLSEANPLARVLISLQSPLALVCWKLLTVGVCLGILFATRQRRCAELGAWAGAVVLAVLMFHWTRYIDHTAAAGPEAVIVSDQIDRRWVRFDPRAP